MTNPLQRYDYILIAIVIASAYAVSHLVETAYFGVWMLLMVVTVCLWLFVEGLTNMGKAIWMKIPFVKEEKEDTEEEDGDKKEDD